MRPLSSGQALLAHAASSFKANPDSWCSGWGIAPDGIRYLSSSSEPPPEIVAKLKPCCIDVRLMQLAPKHGGKKALKEARRLIRMQMSDQMRNAREAIWHWNDDPDRTPAQVIDLLETASGAVLIPKQEIDQLLFAFETGDTALLEPATQPEKVAA